jgi:hypothetical protein
MNEGSSQLREFFQNLMKLLRPFIRIGVLIFKGIKRGILNGIKYRSGAKSYRNFLHDRQAKMLLTNLSKEDVAVFRKLAKDHKLSYALLQKKNDGRTYRSNNRFTRLFRNRKKEVVQFDICVNEKDKYIINEIEKIMKDERIRRQRDLSMADKTDFNMDGIVDEKDYEINSEPINIKANELEFGKEYGTNKYFDFKDNFMAVEMDKKDFSKIRAECHLNLKGYSAVLTKNRFNKDVVTLTSDLSNKKEFDKLAKHQLNEDKIFRREYHKNPNYQSDNEHTLRMKMNNEEYTKFQKNYKNINYDGYETKNKNQEKVWIVTFDEREVKKNLENNTKGKSTPLKDFEYSKEQILEKVSTKELKIPLEKAFDKNG